MYFKESWTHSGRGNTETEYPGAPFRSPKDTLHLKEYIYNLARLNIHIVGVFLCHGPNIQQATCPVGKLL
jgi:hypothetical protein